MLYVIATKESEAEHYAKRNDLIKDQWRHVNCLEHVRGIEKNFEYTKIGHWWDIPEINKINVILITKNAIRKK